MIEYIVSVIVHVMTKGIFPDRIRHHQYITFWIYGIHKHLNSDVSNNVIFNDEVTI